MTLLLLLTGHKHRVVGLQNIHSELIQHVKLNEVTGDRQGKETQDNSFLQRKEKKRATLGGIQTHGTLLSRRALCQLGHSVCAISP